MGNKKNNDLSLYANKDDNMLSFLQELSQNFKNVKVSTDESNGSATFYGERNGKKYSMNIDRSDIGENRTISEYDTLERKSDYKAEVIRLYRQGLRQKDIALRLGISQSLVSKLLKD